MTLEELLALVNKANDTEALGAMDRDAAIELRDQLKAGYDEFRPTVTDAEGVEALRQVVAALAAAQGRVDQIDTENASIEEELAKLDAEAAATAEGGDGEEAPAGDPPAEEQPDGGQPPSEEEAPPAAPPAESPGEQPQAERRAAGAPDLGALGRTPPRPQPQTQPDEPETRMVAAGGFLSAPQGTEISVEKLGAELARQHQAVQTLHKRDLPHYDEGITAGGRKIYLANLPIIDRPGVVHMQDGDGREVIDRAVAEFVQGRDERLRLNERRLASGGDCVMALPDFSINLIGERGTCFTDDLPTVAGTRPLTYYPWFKIDQGPSASGRGAKPDSGIGFVTSEQDAAGYGDPDISTGAGSVPSGGSPYKECIHIDCPDEPLTCSQEAVYKCVTIGNFQAISHPEYVNAWQQYMDIWFDIERDARALNSFIAEATAQDHLLTAASPEFNALTNLKDIFHRLLAFERSARHSPNLSFNIVAPDWFGGPLALDVMLHTFGTLDNLRTTPAGAMALASTDGIRMSTYCTETWGSGTGHVNQVFDPIGSGTVPDWPAKARLLMYPDGAVFKKTAGDLQIGLRETLMKTNDFGMFQESFEKVCYRGDVYVLDVEICANGATGAPVAVTCGA